MNGCKQMQVRLEIIWNYFLQFCVAWMRLWLRRSVDEGRFELWVTNVLPRRHQVVMHASVSFAPAKGSSYFGLKKALTMQIRRD